MEKTTITLVVGDDLVRVRRVFRTVTGREDGLLKYSRETVYIIQRGDSDGKYFYPRQTETINTAAHPELKNLYVHGKGWNKQELAALLKSVEFEISNGNATPAEQG